MSIPKDFAEALDTHLELAGKLLDQASVLKDQVDRFERCKAESDFKHKLAMYELRERYANAMAMARLMQAFNNDPYMAEQSLTVGGMPIPDTDRTMSVRHTPMEWYLIWSNVYLKVHKYRKNLLMQYSYGRNPSFISATPVVVVNKD